MKKQVLATLLCLLGSCASYENFRLITEEFDHPSQDYDSTYDETWQAVISVMKEFDIIQRNQETGIIKTRWMENTKSYNFVNTVDPNRNVKEAKFQLQVNLAKGFRADREMSRVTLYKRQLLEQGILQGLKEVSSDGILEKILLYRIDRLLKIEKYLNKIQKQREKEELKELDK